MVASRAPLRDEFLARVLVAVRERLAASGVNAEVTGRPKHLWSIYEKMVVRGKEFDELYDLVGIRVIVESEKDCWAALGSIHAIWPPVQGRFKDYINSPKFNLYQSLHTTVIGLDGKPIEVQVRTHEMHRRAEYGIAAHWGYKEGGVRVPTASPRPAGRQPEGTGHQGAKKSQGRQGQGGRQEGPDDDAGPAGRAGRARPPGRALALAKETSSTTAEIEWMQRIVDFQNETTDPIEFLEALKLDLEEDEVYVFTPKGKVIALAANATPGRLRLQHPHRGRPQVHRGQGQRPAGAARHPAQLGRHRRDLHLQGARRPARRATGCTWWPRPGPAPRSASGSRGSGARTPSSSAGTS